MSAYASCMYSTRLGLVLLCLLAFYYADRFVKLAIPSDLRSFHQASSQGASSWLSLLFRFQGGIDILNVLTIERDLFLRLPVPSVAFVLTLSEVMRQRSLIVVPFILGVFPRGFLASYFFSSEELCFTISSTAFSNLEEGALQIGEH
ncbi:GAF domain-containing protein [Sesbania bispinosa]|nr:GAF domain-containing protein [Sesbania bispinosa]